jgi:hypothetical protein
MDKPRELLPRSVFLFTVHKSISGDRYYIWACIRQITDGTAWYKRGDDGNATIKLDLQTGLLEVRWWQCHYQNRPADSRPTGGQMLTFVRVAWTKPWLTGWLALVVSTVTNAVPKTRCNKPGKVHKRQKSTEPSASMSIHQSMTIYNENYIRTVNAWSPHKGDLSFIYYLIILFMHVHTYIHTYIHFFIYSRAPQQMLRTHRSLEAYCATCDENDEVFSAFPF